MRPQQQTPEPLRFRYRAKLGPWLLALGGALTFTALLVHAARSGMGVPNRGFAGYFAFDPALFWWSAAVIVFAAGLFCLRGVINALGPGKTITLTEENLIFSGKSATDRERIPYRNIAHARCVDLSTTEATIVIRFGRAEKQLASPLFESLPDFYAFWSALRTRLNPAVVQGTDPEGFEQHGSTRRAVESLISRKYWVIGSCIAAAVVVVVYVVRHGPAATEPSPVAAATVLASGPRPMFVAEQITSAAQQAEFEQLHLVLPLRLPLEHLHWVVDRQQQIYFVGEGGGSGEIPHLFALVLPREGITVQVEAELAARGLVKPRGVELDWDITTVKVPKEHAAAAPRCLTLVRQALEAYGLYGDASVVKEVRVKLPAPSFT